MYDILQYKDYLWVPTMVCHTIHIFDSFLQRFKKLFIYDIKQHEWVSTDSYITLYTGDIRIQYSLSRKEPGLFETIKHRGLFK